MGNISPPPFDAPLWLVPNDAGKITNPAWVLWLQSLRDAVDTTQAKSP